MQMSDLEYNLRLKATMDESQNAQLLVIMEKIEKLDNKRKAMLCSHMAQIAEKLVAGDNIIKKKSKKKS